MGLFDHLTCELPLPDNYKRKSGFQTKSLGCQMGFWTITKDRRLIDDDGSHRLMTTTLNFYDLTRDNEWHEYTCEVVRGIVGEIVVVPDQELGNGVDRGV